MRNSFSFRPSSQLSPETRLALEAVRRGGDVLLSFWKQLHEPQIHEKGKGDLVTAADVAAEDVVVGFLRSEMPEAAIVAEEGTAIGGADLVWYVDPLDGTTNFVQQFPVFAVSVGLVSYSANRVGDVVCGAVFNPVTGDVFYGARGQGSYLGDRRLAVSQKTSLGDAVIATGFPRRYHEELAAYLREFAAIFPECRAIRRAGAASLDLCWTAQGIFDAFWEHRLSPWDIAAGVLIVEEAGGVCSDFAGGRDFLQSGNILGAAATLHPLLFSIVREVRTKSG